MLAAVPLLPCYQRWAFWTQSSGFRDLGFRGLGFRDLGFSDLGFRDLGI